VESFFYFLLTGEIPTKEQAAEVQADLKARETIPQYVVDVLRAMPRDSHPMAMFSAAIVTMQRESVFARRYGEGNLKKNEMWDPMYEDAMTLVARLPIIAAYIYRMKYKATRTSRPTRSSTSAATSPR
jgi:citrate synthase